MKTSFVFWVRFMTFLAVVSAVLLLTRLMRAPGTQGLLLWEPSYRSIVAGLVAMGTVPFLLAVAHGFARGRSVPREAPIIGWITLVLSSLVTVVCLAGALYVTHAPLSVDEPVPSMNLLDPSKGIPARPSAGDRPCLRLALSSDPHWGRHESDAQERSRILKTIDSGGYDAFFILGDLCEQGFPEQGLKEAAQELGSLVTHVPTRPMMGNHDALVNAAGRWSQYFFPASLSSDSGSPFYYRVDSGATHVLVLNLLWGEEDFGIDQREWLTNTLESIPREDAVIVLSHCFFHASGYIDPESGSAWYDHPGTIREVVPILEKYQVDLAVSGHNHFMELLEHGGVSYAIVGTLGGVPDPTSTYRSPASRWQKQDVYGFLEVESRPGRLELIFRDSSGAELRRASIPTDR